MLPLEPSPRHLPDTLRVQCFSGEEPLAGSFMFVTLLTWKKNEG